MAWLWLLVLALPAPVLAGWKVAETAHFRVYSEGPQKRLVEQAALLEDFHRLLQDRTGRHPAAGAPRLDVFLVKNLQEATPWRKLGGNVAGFYRADRGRISVIAVDPGEGNDDLADTALGGQQILLHEYGHHFLLGTAGVAYPPWYVEGFAEYFSTARFRRDSIEIGRISGNRGVWLAGAEWLPMEKLLARTPALERHSESAMFYAQSWLLTHYLFRTPGMRDRLVAYLTATAAGADPVEAFRSHIDPDLQGFQQKLRRYLDETSFSRLPRTAGTPASVAVKPLPASAGSLLMRLVSMEHGLPESRTEAAREDVRARAAAAGPDALASRALALVELQNGNRAEARTLLDRLLVAEPDDPDLLRWRAMAAEDLAESQRFLDRAFDAAPNDWRTLHAYARLYQPARRPLPTHALDLLLRAHDLAPQVTEVVLDTAVALARANRLPEAANILEPLAWSPHGGPAAELAERLLMKARAGDRAGLLAEIAEQQERMQARMSSLRGAALSGASGRRQSR
ncbi:hypothetical protein L6Q21_16305 [Sandaracinobacter sp. RS1-74]|uniref:tetratricopeptide repeat protein n=1 Tax=Sandaracinobacteroides sayramensis TaxID=2913411 RepID=UPI001EDB362F|nr:tetratricopeptide repeat protein [Sandaracinobacteroides sayramensis]MCG2842541.1 hypothetical protein [Sandaracinobacteroides sayramensis]